MKTEIFDYPLPENLIAYYPLEKCGYSRLLIVVDRQTQSFFGKCFSDIIDEINPEDVLILNNSNARSIIWIQANRRKARIFD